MLELLLIPVEEIGALMGKYEKDEKETYTVHIVTYTYACICKKNIHIHVFVCCALLWPNLEIVK